MIDATPPEPDGVPLPAPPEQAEAVAVNAIVVNPKIVLPQFALAWVSASPWRRANVFCPDITRAIDQTSQGRGE
jgi:hypothetical protein